jgi:hypothetical protein
VEIVKMKTIVKIRTKSAITVVLLALVIVSVGYLAFQRVGKQEQPAGVWCDDCAGIGRGPYIEGLGPTPHA